MPAFCPILETLLKRAFKYRSCFDFSFISLIVAKLFPFIGVFSFGKWKKSAGAKCDEYSGWDMITVLFLAKNWFTSIDMWGFPQLCAFLTNCFAQSAHNFKVVFRNDRTTLWQEFMMHHAIAIEENRSWLFWTLPLGWLGFGFNVIAIHSWFVTSCDLFEQICIVVERLQHTAWTMSMRCCFCSKFSNLGTIFAAARFMPTTSVENTWHEPNDMPTSSATSLIVIRWLSKIILFVASMFSSVVDVLGRKGKWHRHWHLLGLPQTEYTTIDLVFCSAKSHSRHFKCLCTFIFIFLHKTLYGFFDPFFRIVKIEEHTKTRLTFLSPKNNLIIRNGWYCQRI